MKNNKGYYSWIHSLNSAAIKSQINAQRMLNEQKEEDISKTTPESLKKGGGDVATYEQIRKEKERAALAKQQQAMRDLVIGDFNNDGNETVDDVLLRNELDNADGIPDTRFGPQYSPKFTNPLGAQARLEMGKGVYGDEELAAKATDEEEPDMEDEDYYRRSMMPDEFTVVRESLNDKIFKFLNDRRL